MLRNHLRNQEADFASLTSMRGSRVDARGIQVQGELDADGQMTLSVFNRAKSLKSNSPDAQGQYSQDSIEWYIGDAMDRMSSDNEQPVSHQNVAQRATPSERVPGSKAGTAAKALPSRLSSLSHLRYKGSIQ